MLYRYGNMRIVECRAVVGRAVVGKGAARMFRTLPFLAFAGMVLPEGGRVAGIRVDRWYRSDARLGVRVQTFCIQPRFDWTSSQRKIDAVGGDVSVMARPLSPDTDPPVLLSLAVGAGGILHHLGRGRETLSRKRTPDMTAGYVSSRWGSGPCTSTLRSPGPGTCSPSGSAPK